MIVSTKQMLALGIAMGVGLSVAQWSMNALERVFQSEGRSKIELIAECVARKGTWSTGSNGQFQSCIGSKENE